MLLSVTKVLQIILLFTSLSWALVATSPGEAVEVRDGSANLASVSDQTDDADVVISRLPDGRLRYDFYHVGALELYIEENKESGVSTYDANGNEISLEDYGDEDKLVKRVSKWQFLIKFAKLLAKFGKRALQFFECIGINAGWKCSDEFLDCATQGQPPWKCPEGIVCVGTAAYACL